MKPFTLFALSFLYCVNVCGLQAIEAIQPGACGDHIVFATAIPKINIFCRTSEGCSHSFVLSRPKGKAEWVQVTVRPEGQRAYQLYSGSYEVLDEPVRVTVNVCLPAGTIVEFFYQSEQEGLVALPGIPRFGSRE